MGKRTKHTYRHGRFQFEAILPPKGDSDRLRRFFYTTERRAASARRSAWAKYHANVNREKAAALDVANDPRWAGCNMNEKSFLVWAESRGLQSHRAGWPDFLTRSPSGKLAGIEVKSHIDFLSPQQIQCFRLLEEAGVPVFVWRPKKGIVDWKCDVEERPSGGDGAKAARRAHKNDGQESEATPVVCEPGNGVANPR